MLPMTLDGGAMAARARHVLKRRLAVLFAPNGRRDSPGIAHAAVVPDALFQRPKTRAAAQLGSWHGRKDKE